MVRILEAALDSAITPYVAQLMLTLLAVGIGILSSGG